jgi:hypothetical protein
MDILSPIKDGTNPLGTGAFLNQSGQYETPVVGPGGSGGAIIEIEIDFGDMSFSKTFVINDASASPSSKILVFPSPNPGTDRVGNDWEHEIPAMIAKGDTGNFSLSVSFSVPVRGKRKIYYQIN